MSPAIASPLPGEWFAVIDTAQDPALHPLVRTSAEYQCLIAGKLDPALAATMPYLVRWQAGEPLAQAWSAHGAGRNWGLLLQAVIPIDALRVHLKRFLQARLRDGTVALFRYYDPRVFNRFVRAASAQERADLFDGVSLYAAESAAPGVTHYYHLREGRLHDGDTAIG